MTEAKQLEVASTVDSEGEKLTYLQYKKVIKLNDQTFHATSIVVHFFIEEVKK